MLDVDSASLPLGINYFLDQLCLSYNFGSESRADIGGHYLVESGGLRRHCRLRFLMHSIGPSAWLYHLFPQL